MGKFVGDEPVLAVTGGFIAVNYAAAFLVEHGIVTTTQASTNAQVFVPLVAAGLTALAGLIIRSLVSPAKKAEAWIGTELHSVDPKISDQLDTLNDKLKSAVEAYMDNLSGKSVQAARNEGITVPEQDAGSLADTPTVESVQ